MIHQIEMNIDAPAVSLNNKLVPARGRLVTNPAYKKAIEDIQMIVQYKYRRILDEMFLHFNRKDHFFSMDLYHLIPRDKFWKKSGEMSQAVKDNSNVEKVVRDAIFPRGGKVDDCFVKRSMIFSLPHTSDQETMRVILKIEEWNQWIQ